MQVKAQANHIRMSAKKVRWMADVVRGLDVEPALLQLTFAKIIAARPIKKLLDSAIANATNNFKLDKNNLYIADITVNAGPSLKRWMPRAFGRATQILKHSCHILITLAERVPSEDKKAVAKVKKGGKKEVMEVLKNKPKETESEAMAEADEVNSGTEEGKPEIVDMTMQGKHRHLENQDKKQMKKSGRSFTKKMFNRKSGS